MQRSARHGLSTLEFVMALPILLFVMALMLNFGTVASWKVRALGAARHAAWSSRPPRNGMQYPRPANWPVTANVGAGGSGAHPPMDDPRVNYPVARGPVLPLGTVVNASLLDPSRGFRQGSSHIERAFPLLKRLGAYALSARTDLLDNAWPFWRQGLYSNSERRIPVLYILARAPADMAQAYVQAVYAILRAPFREDLRPLDRDDEFDAYNRRFGRGGGSPDFHPVLASFCSLDRTVADQRVQDLIDRIQGREDRDRNGNVTRRVRGVPETMTRAFIGLYQWVIQQLQAQLGTTPPPPPGQIAAIQAEIDQLQGKIDVLQKFLGTL